MNPTIIQLHEIIDRAINGAIARSGATPPCCKGCFHCCREPAWCSLEEVKGMLASLTEEQRAAVAKRASVWLEEFQKHSFKDEVHPSASDYRRKYLWCPLLQDGECMAYEHRPTACRSHIAYQSKEGCENDDLRSQQKFALFPGLLEKVSNWMIGKMKEGEEEITDHIGILLAKELLGKDLPTASRVAWKIHGDTVQVRTYDKAPRKITLRS